MAFVPKDAWIGAVMLAVAILYWREADKIRISPLDGPVGASGLPKALAWALGALALIMIVRSLASVFLAGSAPGGEAEAEKKTGMRVHLRAVGMLLLGVGYLLIVPVLGYTISIGLLLGAVAFYIGAKPGLRSLLVAAIGAVAFYFLFVRFLGIPLPSGMLYGMLTAAGG